MNSFRNKPGLTWVALVSAAELIAVAAGISAPIQPLLGVVFVLTCPGFLILDMRRPSDPVARMMLGVGASISANILVVTLVLVTDAGPAAPVIALGLVALAALPGDRLNVLVDRAYEIRRKYAVSQDSDDTVEQPDVEQSVEAERVTAAQPPLPAEPAPPVEPSPPTASEPEPQDDPPADTYEPGDEPAQEGELDPAPVIVLGVDINTAGPGPFASLPGIHPDLAERLVAHREANGPFADVHALLDVIRGFAIEEEASKL